MRVKVVDCVCQAEAAVTAGGQLLLNRALVLAALCLFAPFLLVAQLTPQQATGKQIFTQGSSSSQQSIEAILGGGSSRIPGNLMPCASCHGAEGQGRPEGGITPSNITWEALERSLASSDPLARQRPAYDILALRRAISDGVDPAGNQLGLTMPRFRMSDADMDSLISYLHVLGKEFDPGLTNRSIHIGTIVPADGPLAATGSTFVALLEGYFDDLNREGGIYGRKIELFTLTAKVQPSEIAAAAETFVRDKEIFALVSLLVPGAEKEIAEAMQRAGVPVIMPFASGSAGDQASEKSKIFYVLSGLSQQVRLLVRFAHQDLERPASSIAIVFPEQDQELADAAVRESHALSFASVIPVHYSNFSAELDSLMDTLRKANVDSVLFLGDGKELHDLVLAARKVNWSASILQPGALAGADVFDIPEGFNHQVYFSFPALPSDISADGANEYESLIRDHSIKVVHPLLSTSALAAAKVLAEGLRESGRQLSRQKLIDTLAAMYNFNTGLTPPVTFGATRRIGALGGYVVKLDLKKKTLLPIDEWMSP